MAYYTTEEILQITRTMVSQIMAGIGQSAMLSWGIEKNFSTTINDWPAWAAKVNGFEYKGWVWVVYNASDLYDIYKGPHDKLEKVHEDVFCEDLGRLLDELIERPCGMSDEEYENKVRRAYNG